MTVGKVYLVGAGPGDPDLLTWRAIKLMSSCDVVCYDLLISPAILSLVPADKAMIPVGYRGYCGGSIEYGMHPDVIEQALVGHNVLRLKSGDPFIFGRATEECRCLTHHGIDYEIVPGITSALGAAAYAGFPLTSNGMASDVTFVSGHRPSKTMTSWAAMGTSSGTLVLYMGGQKLALHAAKLINEGRDPSTPVALVSSATSYKQQLLTTTLGSINDVLNADMLNDGSPVLVIMGRVVELAQELDWRAKLPLNGRSIMVPSQYHQMTETLRIAGAEVIIGPKIEVSHYINIGDWNTIIAAPSLWLADEKAAKTLQLSAISHKLDIRLWPWCLGGSQSAYDYLAEFGVYLTVTDNSVNPALVIMSESQENGLCGHQIEVIKPNYPLGQLDIAWIDDWPIMELLLAEPDHYRWHHLVTTSDHVSKKLCQLDIEHRLVTMTNIEQTLPTLVA
ncbi:uroporphyrinogen-III C-methyltransferase [Photobacterium carnosum]|uniref:uroporphyrinogen-III C-methyltransferase n=1 Tax=Photobacterium carnosum TaxID=2023717 RepID=UPI001E4415E6|nr:uroporphyrinogen-III C-methyltransferase [Photobacterium carnosum]MCD9523012.1 uroporphyrinogen-III C-methyltransferase [Photobacterium carnosum]